MATVRLVLAVLAGGWLAGAATAAEKKGDSVREVAAELALNVKAVLAKRDQLGIRVGFFTGSGIDHAEAGGMLMAAITQELGALVNGDAKLELKGDYQLLDDPDVKGLKVIRIEAQIKDLKAGGTVKEFGEFTGHVRDATDFARLTGATVAFKKAEDFDGKPEDGKRKQTLDALPPPKVDGKPQPPKAASAFVKGSIVRSHEDSKYDVEILSGATAKGPFAPLPATLADAQFPGLPFVEIAQKHYYQVRVTNRSEVRLAIFLHLDGIDQFTFSEDRVKDNDKDKNSPPKFRFWVVDAGKTITIEGYHKNVNPGEVFGFLTTKAGEGAASKFPAQSQGKVGTICVGLAREKQPGERGTQETVPGDVIRTPGQKVVEFKLGDINEFVTVRYSR